MILNRFLPLLAAMLVVSARASTGPVVGEPAPDLLVKEWVTGQPVQITKTGTNIVVVEFWTAANQSTRMSFTNLANLQKRFQSNGVVVLAISPDSPEKVKQFLQTQASNITFAVAADDARQTTLRYTALLNQRGLPYVFVVGTNGLFLWHGSPMAGLYPAVEQILAGHYDADRARKIELSSHQLEQYLGLAGRSDFRAPPAGKLLLATRTNDVALLLDMAYQIATDPRLKKRDLSLAGAALDQAESLQVTNKAMVMAVRGVWQFASGKEADGLALANQALATAKSPAAKSKIEMLIKAMNQHQVEAANKPKSNDASQVQTNQAGPASPKDATVTP